MKILFVNQTYLPDSAATAQFLGDAASALARSGHEVTVVCANRNYLDNTTHELSEERIDNVRVVRAPMFGFKRSSRLGRALSALACNVSMLWKLLSVRPLDTVVALTSPPLVAWFALLPARLNRARFIYWVMDINPEQAIRAGWLSRSSLSARLLEAALRMVLRAAQRVIVLDRYMAELLQSKLPSGAAIEVVPLWNRQHGGLPAPSEIAEFRARFGLEERFVVMYAGNHSICHPLDTMLEAARLLRDDPGVVFAFIGGGARTEDVRRFRAEHGLSNIVQLGYQEEDAVGAALAAADLQVVVMGEPYVGVVHPSKIYRILGLGLPFVLIGPSRSAIGDFIAHHNVGVRLDHGDAAGLVKLIADLRSMPAPERSALCTSIRGTLTDGGQGALAALLERITGEGLQAERPAPEARLP